MSMERREKLSQLLGSDDVPGHWDVLRLSDVVEMTRRPRELRRPPEIPFIPMQLISEDTLDLETWELRPEGDFRSGTYFESGDVLFARITPCFENGKLGIVGDIPNGWGMGTTEVYPLRSSRLKPRFLAHFLKIPAVRDSLLTAMEGATGRMRVPKEALQALIVPVPSEDEQDRIVATLNKRLADVAEGVARIRSAQAGLMRYRSAALEKAFSGSGRSKASFPVRSLDELAEVQSGIAKGRPGDGELVEMPYIRTANVQAGRLDLDRVKTLAVTSEQRRRHQLRSGDVLVLEGGDADKVGRGWIWSGEIGECLHQNHVFAVRPLADRLLPQFLAYFVNAPAARRYFLSVAKQTTNLASINKANLSALPIPLPSLDEQKCIVRMLDQHVAAAQALDVDLTLALKQAHQLRGSVLADAFAGRAPHPPAQVRVSTASEPC